MRRTQTQEIKEAFRRLCDADPAERQQILTVEADTDPDLWRAAEALLQEAESVPDTFLEPSKEVTRAADRARALSEIFAEHAGPAPEQLVDAGRPGEQIGRYKLIRPLGEGGFGAVWEAEQEEPIRRLVAVKLIKRGMDTKQIIKRFAAERQALALMDHPNISKVLDAGSTEDGRPYFVMELVIGVPIADYCRGHDLDTDERLRLFALVCRAIQHAHDRGIVHRDIKPSNILVTESDGEATPRIIDFGIAKAMDPAARGAPGLTQQRQLMGTPAYMAPEQLQPRRGEVNARSDIYALGVLLHELLTGTTPSEAGQTTGPDLQAAVRQLDALPSGWGRVSRLANVPTDLDWITLKCIELEPERRYGSALEVAQDVRRFLQNEPVLAGPPDLAYRIRKFCRRNRLAVGGAAALLAAALLVGTAGFFWTSAKNRELAARNQDYLREKSIAERALREVEGLSDNHLLASLEARAEEDLWPAVPEKIDAMKAWLAEAEQLIQRADQHRSELATLRARALPKGEPGVATLRRGAMTASPYSTLGGPDTRRPRVDDPLFGDPDLDAPQDVEEAAAQEPAAAARDWAFSNTKDVWRHWLLTDLVQQMERFCHKDSGTMASVWSRLQFASTLKERSLNQHAAAWQQSIDGILTGNTYPGLRAAGFVPQLGLVPLGPDPDSGLFEFLDLATHHGPVPERDAAGRLQLDPDSGVVLVLIPGGTFLMGAQNGNKDEPNYDGLASPNERPVHREQVAAFLLSKFELTQGQWMGLEGGSNPSYFYAGGFVGTEPFTRQHPVEQVQWAQGMDALQKAGLTYPTEAQWEYATRAGTTTMWFFGDGGPQLAEFANTADSTAKQVTWRISNLDDGYAHTAPVGSFDPNPFGLHDVYGNVAEWCLDEFRPNYAATRPLQEPLAADQLYATRKRVVRGGAFNLLPDNARSARRHALRGNEIKGSVGVRPARAIQSPR